MLVSGRVPFGAAQVVPGIAPWLQGLKFNGFYQSIKNLNGTLPMDPGPSKLRDRAMIDTQVFSGSVKSGFRPWVRFLGTNRSLTSQRSLFWRQELVFKIAGRQRGE